jgi:hypothetical protein
MDIDISKYYFQKSAICALPQTKILPQEKNKSLMLRHISFKTIDEFTQKYSNTKIITGHEIICYSINPDSYLGQIIGMFPYLKQAKNITRLLISADTRSIILVVNDIYVLKISILYGKKALKFTNYELPLDPMDKLMDSNKRKHYYDSKLPKNKRQKTIPIMALTMDIPIIPIMALTIDTPIIPIMALTMDTPVIQINNPISEPIDVSSKSLFIYNSLRDKCFRMSISKRKCLSSITEI